MGFIYEVLVSGNHDIIQRRASLRKPSRVQLGEFDELDEFIVAFFKPPAEFVAHLASLRIKYPKRSLDTHLELLLISIDSSQYEFDRALLGSGSTYNSHYSFNARRYILDLQHASNNSEILIETCEEGLDAIHAGEIPNLDYATDVMIARFKYFALSVGNHQALEAILEEQFVIIETPPGDEFIQTDLPAISSYGPDNLLLAKLVSFFRSLELGQFDRVMQIMGERFESFLKKYNHESIPPVAAPSHAVMNIEERLSFYVPENLENPHNNQGLLLSFFKEELAPMPLASFVGFVDTGKANEYVRQHGVFIDTDITTLTHGEFTHAMQFLMIKIGLETGLLDLKTHSLQDIAHALVEERRDEENSGWLQILDTNYSGTLHWGPMRLMSWFSRVRTNNSFVRAIQHNFHRRLTELMDYYELPTPMLALALFLVEPNIIRPAYISDRFMRKNATTSIKRKPILGGQIYQWTSKRRLTLFSPVSPQTAEAAQNADETVAYALSQNER